MDLLILSGLTAPAALWVRLVPKRLVALVVLLDQPLQKNRSALSDPVARLGLRVLLARLILLDQAIHLPLSGLLTRLGLWDPVDPSDLPDLSALLTRLVLLLLEALLHRRLLSGLPNLSDLLILSVPLHQFHQTVLSVL